LNTLEEEKLMMMNDFNEKLKSLLWWRIEATCNLDTVSVAAAAVPASYLQSDFHYSYMTTILCYDEQVELKRHHIWATIISNTI
jgi:hypothetical protein